MAEPKPEAIAAQLSVEERVLLFCVASGTDWTRAGISIVIMRNVVLRGLINRDLKTGQLTLTERGRGVLQALLAGAGLKLRSK